LSKTLTAMDKNKQQKQELNRQGLS